MSLASENLVQPALAMLPGKESPFMFRSNKPRPCNPSRQPGQENIQTLGISTFPRAGFWDMSRESYKTLHAKWPRADWQGGVELILVDSPV